MALLLYWLQHGAKLVLYFVITAIQFWCSIFATYTANFIAQPKTTTEREKKNRLNLLLLLILLPHTKSLTNFSDSKMGEEAAAAIAVAAAKMDVHGVAFPGLVTPPGSSKTHFLGGAGWGWFYTMSEFYVHVFLFFQFLRQVAMAGVRGLEIGGKFVAFTAIGVYLESDAISALAEKWKGKAAEELNNSIEFFGDIAGGRLIMNI